MIGGIQWLACREGLEFSLHLTSSCPRLCLVTRPRFPMASTRFTPSELGNRLDGGRLSVLHHGIGIANLTEIPIFSTRAIVFIHTTRTRSPDFLACVEMQHIVPISKSMFLPVKVPLLLTSCALALLAGCVAPVPPKPVIIRKAQRVPPPAPTNYWHGDGKAGAPRIVVSLGQQRAFFYRGTDLVGESIVSSGKQGFETPPGAYQVIQKDKNHLSTLYGDFVDAKGDVVRGNVDITKDHPPAGAVFRGAKMPYFLRFHSGYGLHAGRVPPHPASHGCVRLPSAMALHFFNNSEVGTPVVLKD